MKKKAVHKKYTHVHHYERPIRWLPVDSRYITPFFKFTNVRGMERIFLEVEITLAILIVVGTFLVAGIKIVGIITP